MNSVVAVTRTAALISIIGFLAITPCFGANSSKRPISKSQELVVTYSASEQGTEVVVAVRNNLLDRELVVQPVLRSANGEESQGQPLTVRAREVQRVPLAALFGGIAPESGQLLLRFNSAHAGNVAASIMFRRGGKEVQPSLPAGISPQGGSAETRVVWYRPTRLLAWTWFCRTSRAILPRLLLVGRSRLRLVPSQRFVSLLLRSLARTQAGQPLSQLQPQSGSPPLLPGVRSHLHFAIAMQRRCPAFSDGLLLRLW